MPTDSFTSHSFNFYIDEFNELGVDSVIAEARRIVGDAPTYLSWDLDVLDPAYAQPWQILKQANSGFDQSHKFRVIGV